MAEWRYLAARLHGDGTETIIHPELPLEDVSNTDVLSGPAGHSSSISPAMAFDVAPDGLGILEPWSTAIYAEEDGVIRHGCILTDRQINGPSLALTGAGFTAAIKDMPYTGTGRFFVKTDPIDIARAIWDHWQEQDGGNLGLRIDRTTKSPKLVGTELKQVEFDTQSGPVSFESGPYKLNEYSTDDLGGALDGLAGDQGFAYRERHQWSPDGTTVEHYLDFAYPRFGRRRDDLIFQVGANLFEAPSESDSSDQYVSGVLVRGAGDGASMKRKLIIRGGERRLRRIGIHLDNRLKSDSALVARGASLLNMLIGSNDITQVVVSDSNLAPLGSWALGDDILIQTDNEWDGESSMWVRVLSQTVAPAALGVVTLNVMRADKIPT